MKIVSWLSISGFALALLLIGCATAQKPSEVAGHPNSKELCAQCHTIDRVERMHDAISQDDMRKIVERMQKKPGSGFDVHDIDDIVRQLY